MILSLVLLAGGGLLLYLGAEWLIRGAAEMGGRLGLKPLVIGLTVVSVGTSAPELVVCILAVLQGSPELVMGNVLGSNMANVGLILGLAAVMSPLGVAPRVVRRDLPWMLLVTAMVLPLFWNLQLGRVEGSILVGVLVIYLISLAPHAREEGEAAIEITLDSPRGERRERPRRFEGLRDVAMPLAMVLVGSLALVGGGQGIVRGATRLALELGVSELLIGLSAVAIGTSLPELATTVVAAARRETDMAVGNIVGSNIFNLTFVLGGTALVQPFTIMQRILLVELPITFLLSLLLVPLAIHQLNLNRWKGGLLLAGYLGGWVWMYAVR